MAIQLNHDRKITIDLDGPQGNVFHLLALGANLARQCCIDEHALIQEMKQSDYTHAVLTLDKHFGHAIVLQTKSAELIDSLRAK